MKNNISSFDFIMKTDFSSQIIKIDFIMKNHIVLIEFHVLILA
jgi:hypothetical protein